MGKEIIFIFSLPRSGSTLLQRLLASHDAISSVSEPWILLPFLYTLKPYGVFTEYSHSTCYKAIQDFIVSIGGKEHYYQAIGQFATNLYNLAADSGARYFLDKTPRYYLIVSEIARVFPNAKFIFLFRNPLQVLSSSIETWHNGRLRLHGRYMDYYKGPKLLASAYEQFKKRSISVNFDNLIREPIKSLVYILDYLGLDRDAEGLLGRLKEVSFDGRMGDRTGCERYCKLEEETINKWKETFNTSYRIKFAMQYLSDLGCETLRCFGYDLEELIGEVEAIRPTKKSSFGEVFYGLAGPLYRFCELSLFKRKIEAHRMSGQSFTLHT